MREGGPDGFSEREFPRDWDPIPYPQAEIAQMHHSRHREDNEPEKRASSCGASVSKFNFDKDQRAKSMTYSLT